MRQCWNIERNKRPTFNAITLFLDNLFSNFVNFKENIPNRKEMEFDFETENADLISRLICGDSFTYTATTDELYTDTYSEPYYSDSFTSSDESLYLSHSRVDSYITARL